MTPNPDSPKFVKHYIPDNASELALKLRDGYRLLQANISACVWPQITSDNINLTYNTYDGSVIISVSFTDTNNHTHTVSINFNGYRMIVCGYLFEGSIDVKVTSFRSYAEWLMLQLWQFEIDAELCKCDRGLIIQTDISNAYDVLSKMLDIVTNNIKPIDWFLSKEPVWQFYRTYYDLCKMLPVLQEEAAKERWKDVKPENFRLIRNADCALICLDYTDNHNYTMKFRVGMKKGGFAAERTDKFMDMFYEFESHACTKEARDYYEKENRNFSEIANIVLDIPFSWKALFFHAEEGFYINTYRENTFQKYCLMLDCILPLKNKYQANETFIPQDFLEQKKKLEESLGMDLDIVKGQEPDYIFNHGHYVANPVYDEFLEECPF